MNNPDSTSKDAADDKAEDLSWRQTDPFTVFFLQRLHEALFDYSADSFKAPALNSHLRAIELRTIGAQAEAHDYLTTSTESFFDEIEWSIKNDPVLKGSKKELIRELLARAKSGWAKPSQLTPAVAALELQFNDYYDSLKSALVEEAGSSSWSKQKVIQLIDCLIVELELMGFPRAYIYAVAQKINMRKRQGRLNKGAHHSVELFFKHFGTVRRKYSANLFVSSTLAGLIERFPNWTRPSKEDVAAFKKIKGWDEYLGTVDLSKTSELVSFRVDVLCAQSAAKTCINTIDRIAEQVNFIDHHAALAIHEKVFCVETSLSIGVICSRPSSPLRFVGKTSRDELEAALDVFRYFFTQGSLSQSAQRRLARAFEYHSAALVARRPEDQLLNLWSCLEGFVGVPASAGSKIAFVREAVLSSLSLLYPQRLFSLTYNRLVDVLGQENVANHFGTLARYSKNEFEQLAILLLSPVFNDARGLLAKEVGQKEPVLLFRLYELVRRFETPEVTKTTVIRHREKVAWQLNRIYWNRNLIVHSAESLPYLTTLVEHLHIYIDAFLSSILMVAAESEANTIPSVLELIGVHEKQRLNELNSLKASVAREPYDVMHWVFGGANILREHDGL